MIDADAAAEVARQYGLTLSDARALTTLAADVDHARKLAAMFAPDSDDGAAARIRRSTRGRA